MTGSHSELRNWQSQVPKNRKVFRRILSHPLQATVNPPARAAEKPHSCSVLRHNLGQKAAERRAGLTVWLGICKKESTVLVLADGQMFGV
jgi:hypothetical protein